MKRFLEWVVVAFAVPVIILGVRVAYLHSESLGFIR